MLRRKFLGTLTLLGAGGAILAARMDATRGAAASVKERTATVTYAVQGFTCITCAVGLETILGREQGVLSATASYPDATTNIHFDPVMTSKSHLAGLIKEAGFSASEIPTKGVA